MWKYTQHSFAGGVQDVRLVGRQDIDRYAISARTLDNFQVMRQGCIVKRRGTDCVKDLGLADADAVRLIPFVYERDQSYVFVVKVVEGVCSIDVYDCNATETVFATLSGEAVRYAASDLKDLRWVQTGDVVVVVHRNHPPIRLTRKAEGFIVDVIDFKNLGDVALPNPPKILVTQGNNPDAKGAPRTVYYAATAVGTDGRESDLGEAVGVTYNAPWTSSFVVTVRITEDDGKTPIDKPADGVAYYNIYKKTAGTFGFIGTTKGNTQSEITEEGEDGKPTTTVVSSVVAFQDDFITPDVSITPPQRLPFFNTDGNYPATVSVIDQRLVFAASAKSPYTVWWSTVGDFYNFNEHETVRDDDGFSANIPATELPRINHIISTRDMLIFSDGGEWVAEPVSGEVLTLKSLSFKRQSQVGASALIPPTMIEDKVVFTDATRETVHTIDYNLERDGYKTQNVTILSQSLFDGNPIKAWAYAQHPDSTLWCVLEDGTIATLAYMQEHELAAWSHQTLGGGMRAVDICCTKEVRNGCSAVFILAQHVSGTYTLLRVRDDVEPTSLENGLCLDNLRKVTVGETAMPLEEDAIAVHAQDGSTRARTLLPGQSYYVGYPIHATFRSITPEAQGESTIQFELKDAISAELRLRNVTDFSVVPTELEGDTRQDTEIRERILVNQGKVELDNRDITITLAGHANTSGAITLRCDSPFPLMLLSMNINYELDPQTIGVN